MHVGIIMDGNRRFAKRLALDPKKGHEYGANKFKELLQWAKELGVNELTLYTLSVQNFQRPKIEFDYLMNLFRTEYRSFMENERYSNIKIRFLGRLHMLPDDVQEMIKNIVEKTAGNKPFVMNFAFAYGGREEILDAVNRIAGDARQEKVEAGKIDEKTFANYLYNGSQPDLIIRTGGEMRLSNFLPFQSAYSELFFSEKMWPEFGKEDFSAIIADFNARQRRFGK